MTKRSLLGISAFLNFLLFAVSSGLAFLIFSNLRVNITSEDVVLTFSAVVAAVFLMLFILFALLSFITFVLKLIAARVERNLLTAFVSLFDITSAIIVIGIGKDSLAQAMTGDGSEGLVILILCAILLLPILFSALSFVAEKSK